MTWHVPGEDLRRYAAGGLTAPVLWSVEAHLAACPTCRAGLTEAAGPQLVDIGWARIDASLDAPVPGLVERLLTAIRVPDHTARLLAATPALRLSWLAAVVSTLILTVGLAHLADPLVFLAAAPLLPLVGVAASFGPGLDPTYEVSLVAPIHSFRLLLLRCVAVVAADTVLCGLASLAMPAPGLSAVAWFLPSLALIVLTLLLAPRAGTVTAAAAVGIGWVGLVVMAAGTVFTVGGQLAAAFTFAVATVVLSRRAAAFDTTRLLTLRRTR